MRRAGCNHMATQYTFIATTKPANKANQLRSGTSLGAASSIATVNTTLTSSHTKNPASAAPATPACRDSPRTIKAAGTTTANAP